MSAGVDEKPLFPYYDRLLLTVMIFLVYLYITMQVVVFKMSQADIVIALGTKILSFITVQHCHTDTEL